MKSATETVHGVQLAWAAVSDRGLSRTGNEDSILAEPGLFVVADGMGGHEAGEVASALTVNSLKRVVMRENFGSALSVPHALAVAQDSVVGAAGDRVIGSTVTGLLLAADDGVPRWLVWNIGDSRCYRIRAGAIERVTRDHTIIQELLAAGEITEADIPEHPDRHVVTRAVGTDDALPADYWTLSPVAGERFVLCSDGLTNEVNEAEILDAVSGGESVSASARKLLQTALERGGHDNVSIIVVECEALEPAAEQDETDYVEENTQPRLIAVSLPQQPEPASLTAARPPLIVEVPL